MKWLDLGDLRIFRHAITYMRVSLIDLNCTGLVPLCLANYVLNFLLLSVATVLLIHMCHCVLYFNKFKNSAIRIVTGCLKPTPIHYLLIIAGIPSTSLRRDAASLRLAKRGIKIRTTTFCIKPAVD